MDIEQEVFSEGPAVQPADDGGFYDNMSGGQKATMWSFLTAIIVTGGGLLTKYINGNRRSRRKTLEEVSDDVTIESLLSARMRISELEAQNRQLLTDFAAASMAQIQADGNAQRAALQAQLAEEASVRASAAAARSAEEARISGERLHRALAYVATLKDAMIAEGITPPPEPA